MGEQILIADDAVFIRRMLKDILLEADFEVVGEAGDGEEIIELYKELKPDLVIMDIVMPGKNGIVAVEEIMEIDSEAKILICTAMGQESILIKAVQAGAKDFIVKPFHNEKLLETINDILN